jgi:hypothetical protein
MIVGQEASVAIKADVDFFFYNLIFSRLVVFYLPKQGFIY